ncbi:MAG: hypothetical protein ACKO5J_14835, partial [Rubrivivax sp.]
RLRPVGLKDTALPKDSLATDKMEAEKEFERHCYVKLSGIVPGFVPPFIDVGVFPPASEYLSPP